MFIQLHPSCRLFKEKNRGVAHSSDVSECASCDDVDNGWSDEEGEDHNVEAKHHNRFYKAHMFWNGGVDKYVIHVFQHVQEELESTFFTEEERTNRIVRWISELCVVSAVFFGCGLNDCMNYKISTVRDEVSMPTFESDPEDASNKTIFSTLCHSFESASGYGGRCQTSYSTDLHVHTDGTLVRITLRESDAYSMRCICKHCKVHFDKVPGKNFSAMMNAAVNSRKRKSGSL